METVIMNFKQQLINMNACEDARLFVGDKTIDEAWEQCQRGDWMLWIYKRAKNYDFQLLTLAKGHCANTVRHLMKDKRSTDAVDMAIKFGEGNATRSELAAAYAAAAYAADADADDADDAARSNARKANQKATSDICRKYLPIPIL